MVVAFDGSDKIIDLDFNLHTTMTKLKAQTETLSVRMIDWQS